MAQKVNPGTGGGKKYSSPKHIQKRTTAVTIVWIFYAG
jgi:hypothetical protein